MRTSSSTGYRFDLPDPTRRDSAAICASAPVWQSFAAVAGPGDGWRRLFEYLTGGSGRHAYDGIGVLEQHKQPLDEAADVFVGWVRRLFTQPRRCGAWRPDRLDYRFACEAPTEAGAKTSSRTNIEAEASTGTLSTWEAASLRTRRRPRSGPRRSLGRSFRHPCATPACRIRAGGRSKMAAPISATSARIRRISPSSCSSSSGWFIRTTGSACRSRSTRVDRLRQRPRRHQCVRRALLDRPAGQR